MAGCAPLHLHTLRSMYRVRSADKSRVLGAYKMTLDPCAPVPIQQRPLGADESQKQQADVASQDGPDIVSSSDGFTVTNGSSSNSMISTSGRKLHNLRPKQQTRRLRKHKKAFAYLQSESAFFEHPEQGSIEQWSPVQQPRGAEMQAPDTVHAEGTSECDAGARRTITWQKVGPTTDARGHQIEVCRTGLT